MRHLTDDAVLDIFHDMPGHRGCDESELRAVEKELGVVFPRYYRQLMLLDAHRLINTGMIIPLERLPDNNRADPALQDDEPPVFTLPRLVFAFDDIRAYFALDAVGGEDSPVYEFDYHNADEDSRPIRIHDSLRPFIADVLRGYLGL